MNAPQASTLVSSTEMLARLVAFDTTSHNSNLDLIEFVRHWLDAHGVPYRMSFDASGTKANLHAIIGPMQPGGLALSGHVDTVSVEGQRWTGDPFTLRRRDGKLLGRGACDMKGFVAAALAAVPDIKSRPLIRPVHLFLTYDEEVGYHGARRLVQDLVDLGLRPAACVVGEASAMKPILAHKGRLNLQVAVRGLAAHSSEPHKSINAVHAAAEAVAYLAAESRRFAHNGPFESGFDPPYTTVQVNTFEYSALPNTSAGHASFDVDWRNIPADNPEHELERLKAHVASKIEAPMQAIHSGAGFDYTVRLSLAALSLSPEHELARAVCEVTDTPVGGKVSFCSEGSLYQSAGIASVVCGPGHVTQVHQPDEWIAESQIAACDSFIRRLVDRMAV